MSQDSSNLQYIESGHVDSEVRQRRLQRFHSLPSSPQQAALSMDASGNSSKTASNDGQGERGDGEAEV